MWPVGERDTVLRPCGSLDRSLISFTCFSNLQSFSINKLSLWNMSQLYFLDGKMVTSHTN